MDSSKDKPNNEPAAATEEVKENSPDGSTEPDRANDASGNANRPDSSPQTADSAAVKSGQGLGITALVLAIIACLGTIYMWYRFDIQARHQQEISAVTLQGELKAVTETTRALEKQQEAITTAQDKLSTSQKDIDNTIQAKLDSSVGDLKKQQAALTDQQKALADSVSKIYDSMDRSIDSWALEEVEQLLRMANHSVSLAGDIQGGTTGLELADKRLAELGNPELLDVRRLIGEEIGQLNAITQADLPGLAFKLAGIIGSVNDLPLANEPERPAATAGNTDTSDDTSDAWLNAGHELLNDLTGLVRIQNIEAPPKPLLPPEQRYFLTGNLRLTLQAAQIAVLRADTETFKANIAQAEKLLNDYFDTSAQSVQTVLAELKSMSGENLTVERPDISGSLDELSGIKKRMAAQ